jgi:aryl-alcohol dehydrogenase-like predicted oxidoreductase
VPSAVLREAVAAGVNHIDTADYYGPHVTNQIVHKALHPYPAGLVIVTKLGGRRPPDKSWQPAISPQERRVCTTTYETWVWTCSTSLTTA